MAGSAPGVQPAYYVKRRIRSCLKARCIGSSAPCRSRATISLCDATQPRLDCALAGGRCLDGGIGRGGHFPAEHVRAEHPVIP